VHSIRNGISFDNCFIPIPEDTSASVELDINMDFINDFKINAFHNKMGNQCGRCAGYSYLITIQGNQICVEPDDIMLVKYLNDSSNISNKLKWNSSAILSMYGCKLPYNISVPAKYLGIRINNNYGWIKVSGAYSNGITICAYGFNYTKGKSILAGQTE
jgi:hypothetical protein